MSIFWENFGQAIVACIFDILAGDRGGREVTVGGSGTMGDT